MNTFSQVWVFSDTPSRLPELMNGAQALANQINTFVLNDADGAQAIQLGANHVWKLNGKPDDRMIEDYAGVMADTIRQHGADGLVLLPNTRRGKLLAAKLGYRLKAAVSNDASTVSVQDGKATVKHMVYGGLAIGEERIATPYAVLTISSGTFDAAQPDASRTGETHTVEWQAPAVAITRTATQARPEQQRRSRQSPSGGQRRSRYWQQREHCAGRTALQGDRCGVGLFSSGGGKRKMDGARTLCRYLQPDAET